MKLDSICFVVRMDAFQARCADSSCGGGDVEGSIFCEFLRSPSCMRSGLLFLVRQYCLESKVLLRIKRIHCPMSSMRRTCIPQSTRCRSCRRPRILWRLRWRMRLPRTVCACDVLLPCLSYLSVKCQLKEKKIAHPMTGCRPKGGSSF